MSTGPHAVLQKVCPKVNFPLYTMKTVTEKPFRPMFQLRNISNWIYRAFFHTPPLSVSLFLSFLSLSPRVCILQRCVLPLTTGPWRRCSSSAVRCCRSPAVVSSGRRWAELSNTGTRLHQCSGPLTRTPKRKVIVWGCLHAATAEVKRLLDQLTSS